MTLRGKRSIPRVDYKTFNSVGFGTSGSSCVEESSASGWEVHDVQVDINHLNDVDSELLLLWGAVAKKEAEKQKLVDLFVLLLYVPSQQLGLWRDSQFT